jgi:D-3-phosphoglycerate dehydrogenase
VSDYITLHVSLTPETHGLLSTKAFAAMKQGVRIVNCARGELIDEAALQQAIEAGTVAGAALDAFSMEPPPPGFPLFALDSILATPHIGGSTEEAQEIVGVRIAEQVVEYLQSGVAINAVNMPALSPDQYRTLGPYISLAERLGNFAAHIATGNPKTVRLVYQGKIADSNTNLLRSAAVAGVLNRSLPNKANLVNAMQIAAQRGWSTAERHETRSGYSDSIRLELETDAGVTTVEGAVLLGKARLTRVDEIYCEVPLAGHLIFMKNQDVPGVIGYVGGVLGRNKINIANFSLGRCDTPKHPGDPLEAVAVVATDGAVPDKVLAELQQNSAVKLARSVEFL